MNEQVALRRRIKVVRQGKQKIFKYPMISFAFSTVLIYLISRRRAALIILCLLRKKKQIFNSLKSVVVQSCTKLSLTDVVSVTGLLLATSSNAIDAYFWLKMLKYRTNVFTFPERSHIREKQNKIPPAKRRRRKSAHHFQSL